MAVRIKLTDGSAFVVDSTFAELREQIAKAIGENVPLIEVRNGNGQMRSISPRQIVALEETDEDALTSQEEEVLAAVRDDS